jgi:hypothetical protein
MTAIRMVAIVAVAALTVLGLLFVTGTIDAEFLTANALKLAGILAVLIIAIFSFKALAGGRKDVEAEKPPIL